MQVRPPESEELAAVAELHTAAAEAGGARAYDAETTAAWAKRGERSGDDYPVDDPASRFVVAVDAGVLGFGEVVPDEREVRAVYVRPDRERGGVGSAILAHLEGYAAGAGCSELTLQSSLNAVGFYERAGYERVGEGESPGGIAVVEMRKDL
ncbi:GNAT family N-acetyltransferase [Halosegnis marinus]|uniref:GNAT family N-acetyltransferase n=2 Tax=Halosegnis marinus TaxID=3034023 RepID=A0ABD5ZP90_9EURY|nr:GNAT family N-acetyltransferase [Halosegnis sp. DT85]